MADDVLDLYMTVEFIHDMPPQVAAPSERAAEVTDYLQVSTIAARVPKRGQPHTGLEQHNDASPSPIIC